MTRRRQYGAKGEPSKARYWVQLEHYLLACAAYKHLSANAKVVYTEVKRRYNGVNNGLISISAREAAQAIGGTTHHSTGARALSELVEHGFIAVTEDSNFNRKVHLARQYRLTEAKDDRPGSGIGATKDFIRWAENKTQSHPCDTTVAPMRHHGLGDGQKAPDGRTQATVGAIPAVEQSHPCDTIRLSAIPQLPSRVAQDGAEEAPVHTGRAHRSDDQAGGSVPGIAASYSEATHVSDALRLSLAALAKGVANG